MGEGQSRLSRDRWAIGGKIRNAKWVTRDGLKTAYRLRVTRHGFYKLMQVGNTLCNQ
jgi:hypothetical protein